MTRITSIKRLRRPKIGEAVYVSRTQKYAVVLAFLSEHHDAFAGTVFHVRLRRGKVEFDGIVWRHPKNERLFFREKIRVGHAARPHL